MTWLSVIGRRRNSIGRRERRGEAERTQTTLTARGSGPPKRGVLAGAISVFASATANSPRRRGLRRLHAFEFGERLGIACQKFAAERRCPMDRLPLRSLCFSSASSASNALGPIGAQR